MATPIVTPVPTPEPVAVAAVEGTPQQQAREAVQQKYQQLYGEAPPATQETPVTPTPAVAAPAAVTPPENELVTLINSLKEELAVVRAKVDPPPVVEPPKPITPWFERLRQGEWEEAEKDLANRVKDVVTAEATGRAVNEAVERIKVEMEVKSYLTDLRQQNPDIVPFEPYLQPIIEAKMKQAVATNAIKDSTQFVSLYKTIVDAEVENVRKIGQQFRAAGKGEAQIRQSEVLSSQPLQPQQVAPLTPGTQPEPAAVESLADYFTRRRSAESAHKRMNV